MCNTPRSVAATKITRPQRIPSLTDFSVQPKTDPSLPLCGRVDCDPENLHRLHTTRNWVPTRDSIRPDATTLRRKLRYFERNEAKYRSRVDMILHEIFQLENTILPDGRISVEEEKSDVKKIFVQNMFPYSVPEGTNHYVMFYTYKPNEDEINRDIKDGIKHVISHGVSRIDFKDHTANTSTSTEAKEENNSKDKDVKLDFEYIWYENPKMSIPHTPFSGERLYHVQVFWYSGDATARDS